MFGKIPLILTADVCHVFEIPPVVCCEFCISFNNLWRRGSSTVYWLDQGYFSGTFSLLSSNLVTLSDMYGVSCMQPHGIRNGFMMNAVQSVDDPTLPKTSFDDLINGRIFR